MAATLIGRHVWGGNRDSEGHRTWTLSNKVRTSILDGPQVVMDCPGLPTVGSTYGDGSYAGFGNDIDEWAFCYPDATVRMLESRDDHTCTWQVDQKFSTRPLSRCNTTTITDPLLEPQNVGGSFVKFLKAATHDMYGLAILSSSWELFTGREVEFDSNHPTVWVEQNVANLGLSTFASLIDCVNDSLLWGMNPRCVKLSNAPWQRKQYGVCSFYYTRRFEFDIDFNTFDRYIQDSGTRVLNGHHGTAGSGCTINVTAISSAGFSNGAITAATIGSAGSGYQANSTIPLAVTSSSGNGTGATITVQTDGSGAVSSVVVISNGGSGYIVENGLATTGTGWILDNINGSLPDRNNPQHFIRYKDRNGECSRVILDGRGQPAINKYPGQRLVQKYPSRNLLQLGIPTIL